MSHVVSWLTHVHRLMSHEGSWLTHVHTAVKTSVCVNV